MTDAPERIRVRRSSRRLSTASRTRDKQGAWLVVLASAILVIQEDVDATGIDLLDRVFVSGFAALVAAAGSRARRWTWLWISFWAVAFARGIALLAAAVPSLALAAVAHITETRSRTMGALTCGLAIQALLRLPDIGPQGFPSVIVAVAVLPVLVSAWRRLRRPGRQIATGIALSLTGLIVLAGILLGVAAVQGREAATSGMSDARAGLAAVRSGDDDAAVALLASSADDFAQADSLLNGPLTWLARPVPWLAHQATAAGTLAANGAAITETASASARDADLDALRMDGGSIDVGLIRSMQTPVAQSLAALEEADRELADLSLDWLAPPLRDQYDDFRVEIDAAIPAAQLTDAGFAGAPWLLGGGGARRYLVLFGQPAEARFGGGFVGTWAEIEAVDGSMDMVESGPIRELLGDPSLAERTISGAALQDFNERYHYRYTPAYNVQNVTATPDFPTTAAVMQQLYPQIAARPIDGTIYIDPGGVAALLEITGPVDVEGLAAPLSAGEAVDFFTRGVYEQFPTPDEQNPVLESAIEATFDALTSERLPGPGELADVLSPAASEGHIKFSVTDPTAESFLTLAGATGALAPIETGSDYLAVRTANAAPNKLDAYISRTIDYQVRHDPETGLVDASVTVALHNDAPPGLPDPVEGNRRLQTRPDDAPPPGTAIELVSIYTALDGLNATVDGEPAAVEAGTELRRNVYTLLVEVPRGETTTIRLNLEGQVTVDVYDLTIEPQAMIRPDTVRVDLRTPAGDTTTESMQVELDGGAGDPATTDPDGPVFESMTTTGHVTAIWPSD